MDALFVGCDPSEAMIIKAKKDYWRAYNTKLIQTRRKQNHEFSVSFNKNEFAIIQTKLGEDKFVSRYIKQAVLNDLHTGTVVVPKVNMVVIEQQLFLIVEYLQDLLELEGDVNESMFEPLIANISRLQQLIEQEYDNKE